MKKAVATFYKNNEKYILAEFGFIEQGGYEEDARPEEFCVEALARLREGILNKLYGKKTKITRGINKKVLEFIQKIDEIIANEQDKNEPEVERLTKELQEMAKKQEENKENKENEKVKKAGNVKKTGKRK
jgi:gas vesicle protein